MPNGSEWQNEPVTSGESGAYAKISTSSHITQKEDADVVCFNDVSTCSLTTKRRTQGEEEKTNHEDTKWTTVVL